MPTLVFDTVEGGQLDQKVLEGKLVRSGVIYDMVHIDDPWEMLFEARDTVAAAAPIVPNHPEFIFARVVVSGVASHACRVFVYYETFQGATPSAYFLRNRSFANTVETNMFPFMLDEDGNVVPGARIPIQCQWENPNGFDCISPTNISMRFNLPVRGLEVAGLVNGAPTPQDIAKEEFTCYVNNDVWGPPSRKKLKAGWWMLWSFETNEAKYSGYYTYSAVVMTRGIMDWSEMDILVNPTNGKYVKVDPALVAQAIARDYKVGYIWGDPTSANLQEYTSGFIRVGGNLMTNFTTLMGF